MLDLEDVAKYQPEIKRLTKANSLVVKDRVIYIVKKDHTGKAIHMYNAYDYKTKYQLACFKKKDELINFLERQNLGVLDGKI
ncbi:MAG: hypothetical protein ACPG9K_01080 [Poseidonibacter sp.]